MTNFKKAQYMNRIDLEDCLWGVKSVYIVPSLNWELDWELGHVSIQISRSGLAPSGEKEIQQREKGTLAPRA